VQESAGATITQETEQQVGDATAQIRNRLGVSAFDAAFAQGRSEGLTHALTSARESLGLEEGEDPLKEL
jgi:hypothetical protein